MLKPKIEINKKKIKQLSEIVGAKKVPQQMAVAVNKTQTKGVSVISKAIAEELAAPQKIIKKQIAKGQRASRTKPSTTLTLAAKVEQESSSGRLSLRHFKPRQNKKGVSYKISKTRGRKTIKGAFQGPKPGVMKASWKGSVFVRIGKNRLPIAKKFGPSPWGVFVKQKRERKVRKAIRAELNKQVKERLRFLKLKQAGTI